MNLICNRKKKYIGQTRAERDLQEIKALLRLALLPAASSAAETNSSPESSALSDPGTTCAVRGPVLCSAENSGLTRMLSAAGCFWACDAPQPPGTKRVGCGKTVDSDAAAGCGGCNQSLLQSPSPFDSAECPSQQTDSQVNFPAPHSLPCPFSYCNKPADGGSGEGKTCCSKNGEIQVTSACSSQRFAVPYPDQQADCSSSEMALQYSIIAKSDVALCHSQYLNTPFLSESGFDGSSHFGAVVGARCSVNKDACSPCVEVKSFYSLSSFHEDSEGPTPISGTGTELAAAEYSPAKTQVLAGGYVSDCVESPVVNFAWFSARRVSGPCAKDILQFGNSEDDLLHVLPPLAATDNLISAVSVFTASEGLDSTTRAGLSFYKPQGRQRGRNGRHAKRTRLPHQPPITLSSYGSAAALRQAYSFRSRFPPLPTLNAQISSSFSKPPDLASFSIPSGEFIGACAQDVQHQFSELPNGPPSQAQWRRW